MVILYFKTIGPKNPIVLTNLSSLPVNLEDYFILRPKGRMVA